MKILDRRFLPKSSLSVHASTITMFNGHPVFAWFEGLREGDTSVFIRILNLCGQEDSILIGEKDGVPRWNPILFTFGESIYLFSKSGFFCDRWQTHFYNITKWSKETSSREIAVSSSFLPAGLNACVKTKPIFVDGNMFCGSSVETQIDWASYVESYVIENSTLKYRFRSNPISLQVKKPYSHPYNGATSYSQGLIQPSLWHDGGIMHALMRSSYGLGKIYYSKSEAPYNDWDIPTPIDIPNPNSSVDTVYMNGRLFLVCNPVETGRLPLSLVELDNNMKPIQSINITTELQGNNISNEASYPYMIGHDGKLHLTYTYGRSQIEYCVIDVD